MRISHIRLASFAINGATAAASLLADGICRLSTVDEPDHHDRLASSPPAAVNAASFLER